MTPIRTYFLKMMKLKPFFVISLDSQTPKLNILCSNSSISSLVKENHLLSINLSEFYCQFTSFSSDYKVSETLKEVKIITE